MGENNSENEKNLTEEQEELLKLLETEFKDRYTEADNDFKFVWESDMPPPPIFKDWEKSCGNKPRFGYKRDFKDYRGKDYKQKRYQVYDKYSRRTF